MVTSRIPAYSLNSEFNREFRSFRITRATPRSTLYAPAIVPIHEYPRVSVHERREALKAALAKAWSSKSSEKKKHDTWTVPSEQSRAGITAADFTAKSQYRNGVNGEEMSRVALVKHEFENKDAERTDAIDKRLDGAQPASFTYGRLNGNGIDIQETLKKGCEKGLHKDLSYSDYLNNVPKCKTSFENNFLKQNHEDRFSKRNGYDAPSKRVDRDINLNNVEYTSLNGDTYDSLKYSRTANGTESVQYKSYGKAETVMSKLLNTDSPKSVTSCNGEKLNGYSGVERRSAKEHQRPLTSGPKSVVEQRLAERLEVKVAELPALYLGVDSWTPKSAAFQKSMREHEWSVSSEHSWRRRNERSKRSHHRRSPTSHRRRRHHRDESSPRSTPEQPACLARAARARTMAAQPPRPPPNNLLFCGPPPTLPPVVLLPSDTAPGDILTLNPAIHVAYNQTNDADALHDINNVGVPTYGLFGDQVNNSVLENNNVKQQFPPDSYLRRTHSFDISDIYVTRFENDIDARAFRHRRSEPDLSKYGLFVEAEVTMDCGPMGPPPLVLNNPFYDGSYALDPSQLNQTMVVLPDNYLAFEDSFVPWKFKPELLMDGREFNPDLYYDGLPLIPSNDPWSAYGNENAAFDYYPPQFVTPVGEQDGIHYMPLNDFEYAIPQYMSLPTIEQANIETFTDNSCQSEETVNIDTFTDNSCQSEETATPVVEDTTDKLKDATISQQETVTSSVPSAVSNIVISEDEKVSALDSSTNRESSTQSEESLNADISNDITSSLAFVPNSISSDVPRGTDDTSDDTSPCSTDYHEASALDLVQSLDELSGCDSTDYSQSRDEGSPALPDLPKSNLVVTSEVDKDSNENDVPYVLASNQSVANVPLSKLPSIPIRHKLPTNLPPIPNSSPDQTVIASAPPNKHLTPKQKEIVKQLASNQKEVVKTSEPIVNSEISKVENEPKQNKCNDRSGETLAMENSVEVNANATPSKLPLPPHPPVQGNAKTTPSRIPLPPHPPVELNANATQTKMSLPLHPPVEVKTKTTPTRIPLPPPPSVEVNAKTTPSKIPLPPHPPAVPSAWLASRPPNCEQPISNVPAKPHIRVQNTEGQPADFEKSPKPPSQPTTRPNQQAVSEPQPSCSFVPPQVPQQTSQLKPEVEVSV